MFPEGPDCFFSGVGNLPSPLGKGVPEPILSSRSLPVAGTREFPVASAAAACSVSDAGFPLRLVRFPGRLFLRRFGVGSFLPGCSPLEKSVLTSEYPLSRKPANIYVAKSVTPRHQSAKENLLLPCLLVIHKF
jgi:hypothetical protein